MPTGLRILIASPLGHVVAAPLESAFADVTVVVARDRNEFLSSVAARVRFDVVSADLVFNRPDLEWTFDGLDVIEGLRSANRLAPVLLATQGHSMEEDHLAEARLRSDVSGVVAKSDGLQVFMDSLKSVALGQHLNLSVAKSPRPSLFELFDGRRGTTAARLAGAIASGNAADNATLAAAAKVSPQHRKQGGDQLHRADDARPQRARRTVAAHPAVGVSLVRLARALHRELVPQARPRRCTETRSLKPHASNHQSREARRRHIPIHGRTPRHPRRRCGVR